MTTAQPVSLLKAALLPGDPVSLAEAAGLAGSTIGVASRALTYLGAQGVFVQVRQRLWVRVGAAVDPHRLAARIAEPYAFVYGSALALNGAGPGERSEVLVSSPHRFSEFEFESVRYRWARPWNDEGLHRVSAGPEFVWATRPERTLVDCIRMPANTGGIDELARAVDMLPGLDPDEVLRWVDHYGEVATAARLGFLLERSSLYAPETPLLRALRVRRPAHRVYLASRRPGGRLISRWSLIVPPNFTSPPA